MLKDVEIVASSFQANLFEHSLNTLSKSSGMNFTTFCPSQWQVSLISSVKTAKLRLCSYENQYEVIFMVLLTRVMQTNPSRR